MVKTLFYKDITKMYKKYWQILLSEWREKKRNGLTIPFIIGSQKYLKVSTNQDISKLLWDIAYSDDFEVYITYCTDVNDLILGVRDESKKNIVGKHLTFDNTLPSKFFLTKIVYDLGEDIQTIARELSERYQRFIEDGQFSVNDRVRGSYTEYEINFIKKSFSKLN